MASLGAALGYLLERVDAGVEHGEVLELLHRVGDLQEDVLAHVELDQLRERGERRRDGVHVVVRQVQRPQLLNRKLYLSASFSHIHIDRL